MAGIIGSGDNGETSLFSGKRVSKSDPVFHILGNIDELSALLGVVLQEDVEQKTESVISPLLHMLLDIGAEIGSEGKVLAESVTPDENEKLTSMIEELDRELPVLQNFILPTGTPASCKLHFARAVTRRLERSMAPLNDFNTIRQELFIFINRLSRLFFSLARYENFKKGVQEEIWEKGKQI